MAPEQFVGGLKFLFDNLLRFQQGRGPEPSSLVTNRSLYRCGIAVALQADAIFRLFLCTSIIDRCGRGSSRLTQRKYAEWLSRRVRENVNMDPFDWLTGLKTVRMG